MSANHDPRRLVPCLEDLSSELELWSIVARDEQQTANTKQRRTEADCTEMSNRTNSLIEQVQLDKEHLEFALTRAKYIRERYNEKAQLIATFLQSVQEVTLNITKTLAKSQEALESMMSWQKEIEYRLHEANIRVNRLRKDIEIAQKSIDNINKNSKTDPSYEHKLSTAKNQLTSANQKLLETENEIKSLMRQAEFAQKRIQCSKVAIDHIADAQRASLHGLRLTIRACKEAEATWAMLTALENDMGNAQDVFLEEQEKMDAILRYTQPTKDHLDNARSSLNIITDLVGSAVILCRNACEELDRRVQYLRKFDEPLLPLS